MVQIKGWTDLTYTEKVLIQARESRAGLEFRALRLADRTEIVRAGSVGSLFTILRSKGWLPLLD